MAGGEHAQTPLGRIQHNRQRKYRVKVSYGKKMEFVSIPYVVEDLLARVEVRSLRWRLFSRGIGLRRRNRRIIK